MGILSWLAQYWFELAQIVGIYGGFGFTIYTIHQDREKREEEAKVRQISNLTELTARQYDLWKELYERPQLKRITKKDIDLVAHPISTEEWVFVKSLVLHIYNVYRAVEAGVFVKLEGFQKDVGDLFTAPIPKAMWAEMRPFQDEAFVEFVEACLGENQDTSIAAPTLIPTTSSVS